MFFVVCCLNLFAYFCNLKGISITKDSSLYLYKKGIQNENIRKKCSRKAIKNQSY
jgi:hypothetical protein